VPPTAVSNTTENDTPARASGGGSRGREAWAAFGRRFPRGPAMLLLAVLLFTLNGVSSHKVSSVSAIDETYWIDSLVRGSRFETVDQGDPITQEAVRERCTRGSQLGKTRPCEPGHLDAERYGFYQGVNITAGHSPFYFLVTGPIARVLRASPIDLPPNDSLVTWARLLGTAWLLLGWYLVLRVADLLAINRKLVVIALLVMSATPQLLHISTIVNPDQTAVPAGAAMLLAAVAWDRRRCKLWVFALTVLVAAALDPTNGVGLVAAMAYLGFRWYASASKGEAEPDGRGWRDYATMALVVVVAGVLANRGWDYFSEYFLQGDVPKGVNLENTPTARSYSLEGRSIGFWHFIGPTPTFSMFPPFYDVAPPVPRQEPSYVFFARLADYLAIGAMLAVVLRDGLRERFSDITFATLTALLVSPTLIVAYFYVVGGTYDQPIARYGMSAVPILALVVAAAVRTRMTRGLLVAIAVGLYVSAIYVVL
jgi:hypothetical protein